MSYYVIENKNPVIGVVKENGKQEIGVHDYKSGNRRYLEVDKDKVDAFINSRQNKLTKANIASVIMGLVSAAVGAVIGKVTCKNPLAQRDSAFLGGSLGAMAGLLFNLIAQKCVDKSVTEKFVEENK